MKWNYHLIMKEPLLSKKKNKKSKGLIVIKMKVSAGFHLNNKKQFKIMQLFRFRILLKTNMKIGNNKLTT